MKHRSKRTREPARRPSTHWISYALILLGAFAVSAAVGLSSDRHPADPASDARPRITTGPVGAAGSRATPPVASRGPRARSVAPGQIEFESVHERPPTIQHVDVRQAGGRTRLTIASDARARFQIERRDEARRVDITVDAATENDPTAALDLVGTPIRSLRTRSLARRTVLTLALDTPQRIRTRWTGERGEAELVIELEALVDSGAAEGRDAQPAARSRERAQYETAHGHEIVRASAPERPSTQASAETLAGAIVESGSADFEDDLEYDVMDDFEETGGDRADTWVGQSRDPAGSRSPERERGRNEPDRWNDAPTSLGDAGGGMPRSTGVIERSAADRARTHHALTERRAEESIRAARIAQSGGNLSQAVRDYMRALEVLPGHRRAIFEVSPLLVELGRLDDAIALVRVARERAPEEAGLTMLHAQLVARQGDLAGAIKVLERAAPNPADAPEVHALAAAYLQQTGEHALAIDRYETLLRHHPERSRWWMGLGISFEAAGRQADALDVYRIAMQVGELSARSRRWVAARVQALGEEG